MDVLEGLLISIRLWLSTILEMCGVLLLLWKYSSSRTGLTALFSVPPSRLFDNLSLSLSVIHARAQGLCAQHTNAIFEKVQIIFFFVSRYYYYFILLLLLLCDNIFVC